MLSDITVDLLHLIFPDAPHANVARYGPDVLAAMQTAQLSRVLCIAALSTIAAETAPFEPLVESVSRFNTWNFGKPNQGPDFGVYEGMSSLGNKQPGDGARFRGRGFVQLTGRANYGIYGAKVGVDLLGNPDLAVNSKIAAKLLCCFVNGQARKIQTCVECGDVAGERRAVNGGINGLNRYRAARTLAFALLPKF